MSQNNSIQFSPIFVRFYKKDVFFSAFIQKSYKRSYIFIWFLSIVKASVYDNPMREQVIPL